MIKKLFTFKYFTSTKYCFNASFNDLKQLIDINNAIFITDKNIYAFHKKKLDQYNTIVLKFAGEKLKTQNVVDELIKALITKKADKTTYLIGIGGGTITDLVGYVAATYMRGIPFGFIPTTLLAMVDASVGGKNGINIDKYKNIIGTTCQPNFVLYDYSFLATLPHLEWINGFAEIIKHACIKNATMFKLLAQYNISFFQKNKKQLAALIKENVLLKLKIVQKDEREKKERLLLNFGHTIGHAIERIHKISHGQAIAIGMAIDCILAEKYFNFTQTQSVISLLQQYELPTQLKYNKKEIVVSLKMDKKKMQKNIQYILLKKIGIGYIKNIAITDLVKWL